MEALQTLTAEERGMVEQFWPIAKRLSRKFCRRDVFDRTDITSAGMLAAAETVIQFRGTPEAQRSEYFTGIMKCRCYRAMCEFAQENRGAYRVPPERRRDAKLNRRISPGIRARILNSRRVPLARSGIRDLVRRHRSGGGSVVTHRQLDTRVEEHWDRVRWALETAANWRQGAFREAAQAIIAERISLNEGFRTVELAIGQRFGLSRHQVRHLQESLVADAAAILRSGENKPTGRSADVLASRTGKPPIVAQAAFVGLGAAFQGAASLPAVLIVATRLNQHEPAATPQAIAAWCGVPLSLVKDIESRIWREGQRALQGAA